MTMSRNTPFNSTTDETLDFHSVRDFIPTDRQRDLYQALNRAPDPGLALLGYGGAMGGGKTRAIVELAIDAALAYPGNNILVARHNFTDLSSTTMREFLAACPPELIRRRQQSPTNLLELAFPDWPSDRFSTVNFRHLSDWTGLGSQQYGSVLIDEAGEVDEEAALMLLTRLRHPAQPQRWFVAASNPWPGWFERWFVHRDLPEDALAQAYGQVAFVPARIHDNPHLPADYAQLQRALLPSDWVDRFVEGRFDAFMGRVYPHFDSQLHLWQGPLPDFSLFIGGLDFGGQANDAHYTAGIVAALARSGRGAQPSSFLPPLGGGAEDEGGTVPPLTLIRLAEFEDRGPGVTQRLEQWQRACARKLGPIRWCADRSQSAWIDHQRRLGINVVPSNGGPDSVNWGIALVQERLSSDPPTSYYTANLTRFPERMREYQWRRSQTHPVQPRKRNDDLLDADRYMHELALIRRPVRQPRITISTRPRGRIARIGD
jgi:hypothetical protein